MTVPGMSEEAAAMIRGRRRLRAARRSQTNQPKKKRTLEASAKSDAFRRQMRAKELREIEDERRRRVANVDRWAAAERGKVNEKYGVVSRQLEQVEDAA